MGHWFFKFAATDLISSRFAFGDDVVNVAVLREVIFGSSDECLARDTGAGGTGEMVCQVIGQRNPRHAFPEHLLLPRGTTMGAHAERQPRAGAAEASGEDNDAMVPVFEGMLKSLGYSA